MPPPNIASEITASHRFIIVFLCMPLASRFSIIVLRSSVEPNFTTVEVNTTKVIGTEC